LRPCASAAAWGLPCALNAHNKPQALNAHNKDRAFNVIKQPEQLSN